MRVFFRITLMVMLLAVAVQAPQAMGQFFAIRNSLIGEKAPDFTLDTLRRSNVNFSKFRKDDPTIVFFWATWCPHCRTQLKALSEKIPVLEKKGIKIVLVDLEEKARHIRRYLENNRLDIDVFLDSDADIAMKYNVIGVPTFVFIDKSGMVRAVEHFLPENFQEMLF